MSLDWNSQALREQAQAFRLQAQDMGEVLPYLRAEARAEQQARIDRLLGVAADLERAAQRREATGQ